MKKLLEIVVLSFLLSGCGPSGFSSLLKEEIFVKQDYPKETIRDILKGKAYPYYFSEILINKRTGKFVVPRKFDEDMSYEVVSVLRYEEAKKYINFKYRAKMTIKRESSVIFFDGFGSSKKKAEEKLLANCEKYKNDNNINFNCSSSIEVNRTSLGYRLEIFEDIYTYAKNKIKEDRALKIRQAEVDKENYEINKAKKLVENKKQCKEIGFTPKTENFANCILKLIELEEIRNAALLESNSRASLETKIQEQATDIQNKIAEEAKASRDQKAWETLLGLSMGSGGILNSPTSNSTSCFKSSETTSGLSKICYYNCGGTTRALNVNSTQLCPLNANL